MESPLERLAEAVLELGVIDAADANVVTAADGVDFVGLLVVTGVAKQKLIKNE